jgi:polyisoprenoid-binding protein YceI
MAARSARRWAWWLAGAAAAVVVAVVGGTFVYIHFISGTAPAPLSLHAAASPAAASGSAAASAPAAAGGSPGAAAPVAGTWGVRAGSAVGYRVQEVLFGQNNIAVGRTSAVTGSITIKGTSVTAGRFTAQMATIKSDESQRDAQFRGRIMNTAAYPTGTLALTHPIRLAPLPAAGVVRTYSATGNLTLHGHTRPVTFRLSAERTAGGIEVSGSVPVRFANWGIPNPGFGSAITTQNHGELEFLLKLSRS